MDKARRANAAEWILRRVVGSARASELVGDRLESRPAEGNIRFWLSISWLVFVFSWRTVTGILAAVVAGVIFSWIPFAWSLVHLWAIGLNPAGPPPNGGLYIAASMLLWNAAIFFMIRLGFRSDLTWISLSWALLSSFAVCTFWIQNVSPCILGGAIALLLLFLTNPKDRRALAVVFATVACGGAVVYSLFNIPYYPRALRGEWGLAILMLQLLLTVVTECATASFLRNRFLATQDHG